MLGNAGRPTHPSGRPLAYEDLEQDEPAKPLALPPACTHRLQVPAADDTICHHRLCPGLQRDGSCLAEHVRGLESWEMEIDRDGYWCLLEPSR